MKRLVQASAIAAAGLLGACTTGSEMRYDGVTGYAGNAIAANTALQLVDPWQYGVQDTDLKVPSERSSSGDGSSGKAPSSSSATSSTNP